MVSKRFPDFGTFYNAFLRVLVEFGKVLDKKLEIVMNNCYLYVFLKEYIKQRNFIPKMKFHYFLNFTFKFVV